MGVRFARSRWHSARLESTPCIYHLLFFRARGLPPFLLEHPKRIPTSPPHALVSFTFPLTPRYLPPPRKSLTFRLKLFFVACHSLCRISVTCILSLSLAHTRETTWEYQLLTSLFSLSPHHTRAAVTPTACSRKKTKGGTFPFSLSLFPSKVRTNKQKTRKLWPTHTHSIEMRHFPSTFPVQKRR